MNVKETGSYYTPEILSDFLIKHIITEYGISNFRILEPSCGDGSFVKALGNNLVEGEINLDLCEVDKSELNKSYNLVRKKASFKTKRILGDYLEQNLSDYTLVIGNPPYIAKKFLTKTQIAKCKSILTNSTKITGEVKNIWPAFVIKSTLELSESGVLCYVLPSELLQVKHTKVVREFLLSNFSRIEIFAFDELIFKGAEQDVIVFVGKKETNTKNCSVSFYQVEKLDDLKIPDYVRKHTNLNRKRMDKWTNYILSEDELDFVEGVIEKLALKKVKDYCKKAEVGIVTAANDYFIKTDNEVQKLKLTHLTKPILKKSSYLNNSIIIDNNEISLLDANERPSKIILFENKPFNKQSKSAKRYIQEGETLKLHERYKMKIRENWFVVPVTWASVGLFVKRCHLFPKVLYNPSGALATDSFYRIVMKPEYSIECLTFSFYNTLTFILAELEGRFYGGGVLELTPSEFRSLHVPYIDNYHNEYLYNLNTLFKKKSDINDVLDYTDSITLSRLDAFERERLNLIWGKLVKRRLRDYSINSDLEIA